MEIISISIGMIGVFLAAITLYRTRKNELMVRLHLAKLSGKTNRIAESANWAYQHFGKLREIIDSDDLEKDKNEASHSIQLGGGDSAAAHRMVRELTRDIRSIQLSLFGKVEHLQSNGKLVELSKLKDEKNEIPGNKAR